MRSSLHLQVISRPSFALSLFSKVISSLKPLLESCLFPESQHPAGPGRSDRLLLGWIPPRKVHRVTPSSPYFCWLIRYSIQTKDFSSQNWLFSQACPRFIFVVLNIGPFIFVVIIESCLVLIQDCWVQRHSIEEANITGWSPAFRMPPPQKAHRVCPRQVHLIPWQ